MDPSFEPVTEAQSGDVARWLASERWTFFSQETLTGEEALRRVAKLFVPHRETWWIAASGANVGLIELYDLADPTALFTLRVKSESRRRGLGTAALRWLTQHLFTRFAHLVRIEGQTREDNVAMRRLFRKCGFVHEATYRRGWLTASGERLSSTGYAILREDWERGTTTPVMWTPE